MAQHLIHVSLKVKADNEEDAAGIAKGAAAHLVDTFNDDDSIKAAFWNGTGFAVVPLDLLRLLIDGADLAGDERARDAEAFRRDGEDEHKRKASADAKRYRAAVRRALRIERAALPPIRAKRATGSASIRAAA